MVLITLARCTPNTPCDIEIMDFPDSLPQHVSWSRSLLCCTYLMIEQRELQHPDAL
jgi:hypothetical protein